MKNITVTVRDGVYLNARIWAAQNGTSVSALVGKFLSTIDDSTYEDLDFLDCLRPKSNFEHPNCRTK
jgi:hypothetical protein